MNGRLITLKVKMIVLKMDCGICTQKVAESRVIICICEYKACHKCIRRYFATMLRPQCPNCAIIWTREFVMKNFRGFGQEYTRMREKFLFQQELAIMPETQIFAENELKARELESENSKLRKKEHDLLKDLVQVRREQAAMTQAIYRLRNFDGSSASKNDSVKMISRCPTDDCRGFIYEDKYTCGLCHTNLCKRCLTIVPPSQEDTSSDCKEKGHTCKQEDVQSAKLIQKDSKPCPKCGMFIHKIDGCDQMWCTLCKTAFSWETGAIVSGRVHNPHFYEWQRQQHNGVVPRVPGDEPGNFCGDHDVILFELQRAFRDREDHNTVFIMAFHRFIAHVDDQIRPPQPINNLHLRIAYLLKEVSEEEFKKNIQQSDKKFQKQQDLRNIVEVLLIESNIIFRDFVYPHYESLITLEPTVERINRLLLFANQQLEEIGKKFSNKSKKIVYIENTNRHSPYFELK